MTTKELVGPLRRVWFSGNVIRGYDLPRDTCDVRYEACAEHRTACDCREATFAEVRAELSYELREIKDALTAVLADALKGHPTFAPPDEDDWALDVAAEDGPVCRCTGCVIARALYRAHISARTPLMQYSETAGGAS